MSENQSTTIYYVPRYFLCVPPLVLLDSNWDSWIICLTSCTLRCLNSWWLIAALGTSNKLDIIRYNHIPTNTILFILNQPFIERDRRLGGILHCHFEFVEPAILKWIKINILQTKMS